MQLIIIKKKDLKQHYVDAFNHTQTELHLISLCSSACINSWLNRDNTDSLTVTDHLPCQHRVVHFLCTLPIRRTGSIPSCVCVFAEPPRGLDQTEGTCPDPPSGNSVPSSSRSVRQTGAPRGPERCECLSNADPSFGPPSKKAGKPEEEQNGKLKCQNLQGFIHTDPAFHQNTGAVRPWNKLTG